jgi:PAS domain S-box-containing protein
MHSTVPLWRSVKARVTLSMLAISLASLWSLSYFASGMLHRDMERLLGEQQFSAVSVVAAQINGAVESRLQVLESVAGSTMQAMQTGPVAVQTRLEQLTLLPTLFNGGVIVYRPDGTAIAEIPASAGRIGVNYMYIDSVATALRKGLPNVSKPIIGKVLQTPTLGMTVPIRNVQGKVIGALSGLTNLARPNFLDDVTRGAYGKTGGYMLVAPQYRLIVTATDKRRVMEKLPDPGGIALVDRFIQGYEGSGVTRTPQGLEVLASAKGIPVAGWYLAAALPTSEAYAPIHDMHLRMLLATILLTLIACALTWWMIRRQLAPLSTAARALSGFATDTGEAPQSLPISRRDEIGRLLDSFNRLLAILAEREEALKKSERFKDVILNSVAAHIAVLDRKGVIQAVNEPWQRFAVENGIEPGQPASHTSIGVNYLDVARRAVGVIPPENIDEVSAGIQSVLDGRLPAYSTEYPCHAPDQKRWFTMNVMPLVQKKQEGVVITHTDVTAIKQAEEDQRVAAVAFECQEGMIITDEELRILRTNHSFARITGYSNEEVLGQPTTFLRSDRHPASFYENIWRMCPGTGHVERGGLASAQERRGLSPMADRHGRQGRQGRHHQLRGHAHRHLLPQAEGSGAAGGPAGAARRFGPRGAPPHQEQPAGHHRPAAPVRPGPPGNCRSDQPGHRPGPQHRRHPWLAGALLPAHGAPVRTHERHRQRHHDALADAGACRYTAFVDALRRGRGGGRSDGPGTQRADHQCRETRAARRWRRRPPAQGRSARPRPGQDQQCRPLAIARRRQ